MAKLWRAWPEEDQYLAGADPIPGREAFRREAWNELFTLVEDQ
jgi:hypothetical protein